MFRKIDCLLFFFISFPALSQKKTCYSLFREEKQIVQAAEIKIKPAPIEIYRDQGLRKNFLSLEEAQALVQKFGIKTALEYKKQYKELGLPSNPYVTYKDQGWKGWGDFLGTGRIRRTNFPNFEKAKQIAQEAGVKTQQEYEKEHKKLALPSTPHRTYKAQGWSGWGNFLGTGRIRRTNFPKFEEAKQIAQEAGIKTKSEYREGYNKLGLPANPEIIYKDQGWVGFKDFLGIGTNLEEARQIAKKAGIKTNIGYKELGLPSHTDRTYKNQWPGRKSFLESNQLIFKEAKKIAQAKGIRTISEYQNRYKELKELGLPLFPSIFYKNKGWKGWKDFLGDNFQTYKEIQEIAQKAGIKTEAEYKKVYSKLGLPSYPDIIYEEEWPGWEKFLGKVKEKKKRAQNTKKF